MDKKTLMDMLSIGENYEIEFKESKNKLPKSIWETYSAFCNTKGGVIVLGIKEELRNKKCTVEGVEDTQKILKDFWNNINNKEKVSFNILNDDDIQVIKVEGKNVIVINVSRASRRNKPVFLNNNPITGTYKRFNEGDFKCAENEVRAMIIDSSEKSKDSVVLEEYNINNISMETLKNYRKAFEIHKGDQHKWNFVSDEEFLCLINAMERKTKKLTLAGLLMFGNREDILSIVPTFFLDYREVEEIHNPSLRWKMRITSMDDNSVGNIWNFFIKIVNRLTADIEIPFALNEKLMRIENTQVHESVREALVNSLIHFQIDESGSIVIEKGERYFKFSNPGNMRIPIEDAFRGGESDPRNPILHQMFSYLGYGERAGSGLFNINTIWKEKEWKDPIIEERLNPNRTTLLLSIEKKDTVKDTVNDTLNDTVKLNKTQKKILELLQENPQILQDEIAEKLKIATITVKRNMSKLKKEGILERVGADKSGYWKLNL